MQRSLDLRGRICSEWSGGPEHDVAALQHGPHIVVAEIKEQCTQVGHCDALSPPDVDAAKQCDVLRHQLAHPDAIPAQAAPAGPIGL